MKLSWLLVSVLPWLDNPCPKAPHTVMNKAQDLLNRVIFMRKLVSLSFRPLSETGVGVNWTCFLVILTQKYKKILCPLTLTVSTRLCHKAFQGLHWLWRVTNNLPWATVVDQCQWQSTLGTLLKTVEEPCSQLVSLVLSLYTTCKQ